VQFLVLFIEAFIQVLAQALTLAIFVRVLLSWVPVRLPWGLGEFFWSISEPILSPIRRALPFMGGIDFSPIIAILGIQAVASILLRLLPPTLQ
jgi:YggT family protein